MGEKRWEKNWNRFLLTLALVSFFVTLIYSWCYYDTVKLNTYRALATLQNAIKAFTFRTDIKIQDMVKDIVEAHPNDVIRGIIGKVYGVACFTAPYCTMSYLYKLIQRVFKFRLQFKASKKTRHIIIFGYNDEVKALLSNYYTNDNGEKFRIHLVSAANISDSARTDMIRYGIFLHNVDYLSIADKEQKYLLKRAEIKWTGHIVLFEEASSMNFSIYRNLVELLSDEAYENVRPKFLLRCEDDGIKEIIEDYHDNGKDKKREFDIEILNVPQLRISNILNKQKLHSYYLDSGINNPNEWNLHMLIVGFGKLGQEMFIQAMNNGVTGSKNKIIIDVMDKDIDNKRSIFLNRFNERYVEIEDGKMIIGNKNADGFFEARFHKIDVKYNSFKMQLDKLADELPFTYIAICVEDPDVSLNAVSEIKRHIQRSKKVQGDRVQMVMRMEADKQMEKYLRDNSTSYKNVSIIEAATSIISFDSLLKDKLENDAKNYNSIYESIIINDVPKDSICDVNEAWKKLTIFRRNANRAIAEHDSTKLDVLEALVKQKFDNVEKDKNELINSVLLEAFGQQGCVLHKCGMYAWEYVNKDTEDHIGFVNKLNKDTIAFELAKLEHRRWCYFTASQGWANTENLKEEKNDKLKENPCLCNWELLVENQPHKCVYDVMPLLKMCGQNE